jgi:hypothetical protein
MLAEWLGLFILVSPILMSIGFVLWSEEEFKKPPR